MLSLISNIACVPVSAVPCYHQFLPSSRMYLTGRRWRLAQRLQSCYGTWFPGDLVDHTACLAGVTETPFAASGVLVQGGFAAFMIWGQVLAGAVRGGVETCSFPDYCCQAVDFLSFLLFCRACTWKWLLTEIKGDLETLWHPHHFLEYYYNGHCSTKEVVAALLLLVTEL